MKIKRHEGHEREIPNAHIYHAVIPIIFMLIWGLDSTLFNISTILNNFVPFTLRIILFVLILGMALVFIGLSHQTLFKSHQPPNSLITNGILSYMRNPMYLGILLIYVAFILLSLSLISIGLFFIVFLIYNWMANFEEDILKDMYGEEYIKYREKVPKWIPNPFKR